MTNDPKRLYPVDLELGTLGFLAYLGLFARVWWIVRNMLSINKLGGFVIMALVIQSLMVSFSCSDNLAP